MDGAPAGLQDLVGYRPARRGPVRRAMSAVVASGPGSRLSARVLPPVDRLVRRVTRRRSTASSLLGGLPTGFLITTGARSGVLRTTPLLLVPSGEDLAVIGSNWGGANAPGWVHNLQADPAAVLELDGRRVAVHAELVEGPERDSVWRQARAMYSGYAAYEVRAAHRHITVWRLRPVG